MTVSCDGTSGPAWANRVLVAMRPMDIQTTYQEMIERGLSARTVRYTHAVLRSAMRQALRWRLLLENPVDGVKIPQQLRGEMRSLTVEQAQAFLKAALATPHGPVLAVALTTGMRPSEYLALKWQDIDWTRQTVSVVRSVRRLDGRWCFSIPSVREAVVRSNCSVGLLPFFVICRRKRVRTICVQRPMTWSSERRRDSQSMPIISRSSSDQYSTSPVLPRIRLYDLRHSAATIALAAGVSPKVVSEQLGHASTAFTLDTYAHVLPHMQDEAAARVEAMLFRATA